MPEHPTTFLNFKPFRTMHRRKKRPAAQATRQGDFMRILALSISGMPHRWMDIDRAAYYVATDKVAWTLGDPAMIPA
jgi:hypothetical protein